MPYFRPTTTSTGQLTAGYIRHLANRRHVALARSLAVIRFTAMVVVVVSGFYFVQEYQAGHFNGKTLLIALASFFTIAVLVNKGGKIAQQRNAA
jgi:hypothetical protein